MVWLSHGTPLAHFGVRGAQSEPKLKILTRGTNWWNTLFFAILATFFIKNIAFPHINGWKILENNTNAIWQGFVQFWLSHGHLYNIEEATNFPNKISYFWWKDQKKQQTKQNFLFWWRDWHFCTRANKIIEGYKLGQSAICCPACLHIVAFLSLLTFLIIYFQNLIFWGSFQENYNSNRNNRWHPHVGLTHKHLGASHLSGLGGQTHTLLSSIVFKP